MTHSRPAFTLIELTLVTVIILALVGLSVPLFKKTFSGLAAKDAAFNISKFISYAQERAIVDRENCKLTFNFTANRYQLFEAKRSADKLAYAGLGNRFGRAFALPMGISFKDPSGGAARQHGEEYKKDVIFYPDGHCDRIAIEILDKRGDGCMITSRGFGSLVEIKEVVGAD